MLRVFAGHTSLKQRYKLEGTQEQGWQAQAPHKTKQSPACKGADTRRGGKRPLASSATPGDTGGTLGQMIQAYHMLGYDPSIWIIVIFCSYCSYLLHAWGTMRYFCLACLDLLAMSG